MDPNVTLRWISEALERKSYSRAREFRGYLTDWLSRGGFAPDWSAYPRAARYCGHEACK